MKPRRPAPARPGARPGQGRATRASGGATPRRGVPAQSRTTPARTATGRHPDATPAPRGEPPEERSVLRLGGPDGLTVPLRGIVLALVLLFAFIVTFPSLREYLSQRAQYDAVVTEVAEARATNSALEEQLARWDDDEYVRAQARERLSYVMPGETTYVVVDADSVTATQEDTSSGAGTQAQQPWYLALRETARVAGEVPTATATDPAQQGWSATTPTADPTASASSSSAGSSAAPAAAPTATSQETP